MKAAYLLTDSMYSLAISDNGGVGAGNGTLGRRFAGVGAVVGGDGTTGANLPGGMVSWKCPSGLEFGLLELTLIPEQAWKLVLERGLGLIPEEGLVLPVVAGLLQTS